MELKVNGTTVELDETQQELVYKFYRLHCTMETITDRLSESSDKIFTSEDDTEIVATRVLELMDDYNVSEDDAIKTVFEDAEYMTTYTTLS